VNVLVPYIDAPPEEIVFCIDATPLKDPSARNGNFRGLKGHESIAQASAWVYIFNDPALKGRQKSTRALNVSPDPKQIHGFNPGSPDNNN
jgi:hypothetical protein